MGSHHIGSKGGMETGVTSNTYSRKGIYARSWSLYTLLSIMRCSSGRKLILRLAEESNVLCLFLDSILARIETRSENWVERDGIMKMKPTRPTTNRYDYHVEGSYSYDRVCE